MGIRSTIVTVIGSLTVVLLGVGFGAALYNYFIHPTMAVGFLVSKLENGLPDHVTVSNQGNAAATGMLLTISAPQQVQGQILLAADKNTTIDNGSHCGVNCFSVSIPSFSHGSGSLELSSLISNKSNIKSGNYTAIASYAGISAKFVQPLLEKPQILTTSTPGPFSTVSIFATIGGLLSAIATAAYYVFSRERERFRKEQPPDPEINISINIERNFMMNSPKLAEEMLKRFFQTKGEKQE
jgi:hypothetical protein